MCLPKWDWGIIEQTTGRRKGATRGDWREGCTGYSSIYFFLLSRYVTFVLLMPIHMIYIFLFLICLIIIIKSWLLFTILIFWCPPVLFSLCVLRVAGVPALIWCESSDRLINKSLGAYAEGCVASSILRRHPWRSHLTSLHAGSLPILSDSRQEAST